MTSSLEVLYTPGNLEDGFVFTALNCQGKCYFDDGIFSPLNLVW